MRILNFYKLLLLTLLLPLLAACSSSNDHFNNPPNIIVDDMGFQLNGISPSKTIVMSETTTFTPTVKAGVAMEQMDVVLNGKRLQLHESSKYTFKIEMQDLADENNTLVISVKLIDTDNYSRHFLFQYPVEVKK